MSVKLLLVMMAGALCVSRLSTFLYHQPVLTQFSSRDFTADMFPAVTICQWPPFNLSHLLHAAGHPPLPQDFHLLSVQDQQHMVVTILEQLASNTTQSLRDIWWSAQADLKGILRASFIISDTRIDPYWNTVHSSALGLCYTLKISSNISTRDAIKLGIVMLEITTAIQHISFLFIAIHRQDNTPPFWPVPYKASLSNHVCLVNYDINYIVNYQGVNAGDETFGNCLQQCLEAKTMKNEICCFNCSNPKNKDLLPCDNVQVGQFLSAQWQALLRPYKYSPLVVSEDKVNQCFVVCRSRRKNLYSIRMLGFPFYLVMISQPWLG